MSSSSASFAPLLPASAEETSFRPLGVVEKPEPPPEPPPLHMEPSAETEQAFQAGYALGREEVRSQIESIGESFVKSLEELAAFRSEVRARYERELLELALGVARKVVRQELSERPEVWLGMIRHAVRRAVDRERIAIRVPGRLMQFLREGLPELRASLEDVKELELIEDPSLPEGGCVIESRFGDIDIGVETQLAAAERALVQSQE
jgi:flagellar assembly protein FliH